MSEQNASHRPDRFYSECNCTHPDSLDESIPDDVAAEYESDYYEAHFSVSDGEFGTCEAAFSGYGCVACHEQHDGVIQWPCPEGDPTAPLPESKYPPCPEPPVLMKQS